ncbi:hypothetical protein FSPOR_5024 [Fusarium sporotrichioides]|uniref:Transcription factor domain-containing protein n=1 Tax=Fusarium sporotrichioides TaxID=5514 RepID=A0A395S8U1_FUSSP|nr:hypothetical protein FSPOR_5024 [Fusarium sporotrichioides]
MSSASTTKKSGKRDEYTSHACVLDKPRAITASAEELIVSTTAQRMDLSKENENSLRQTPPISMIPQPYSTQQSVLVSLEADSGQRRQDVAPSDAAGSASNETAMLKEQLERLQQDLGTLMMQQSLGFEFLSSYTTPPLSNPTDNPVASFNEQPITFSQSIEVFESQNRTRDVGEISPSSSHDGRQPIDLTYAQTDTFVPGSKWLNNFAVSSQICDLRSSVGSNPVLQDVTAPRSCTITLPCPKDLAQAIKVGLDAVDCYFPSVHAKRLVEAISATLKEIGYSSANQSVAVTQKHHMVICILLIVIAAGQILDGEHDYEGYLDKTWPGSEAYWQSRKLLQHFEQASELRTSSVIYYTLAAAYLLSAERLSLASIHILNALHSAVSLGLDQNHEFPAACSEDFVDPLALWVALDFLDKRITQKCGIPYFIRNTPGHVDITHNTGNYIDAKSKAYLKATFSHARLWASIWDGFLAPNAPMANDWVEIQAFDAKLLALMEQYPNTLSWDGESVEGTFSKMSSEPEDRRRLNVFLSRPDQRPMFPSTGLSESNMNFGIAVDQAEYPTVTNTFEGFSESFDAMVSDPTMESSIDINSVLAEMFPDI